MTTTIQTNTFFCQTCLTDKALDEQSADPRYCQHCLDYLNNHEVPLLSNFPVKPRWMPKVQKGEAKNIQKTDVQKIHVPITPPKSNLHTVKIDCSASHNGKMKNPGQQKPVNEKPEIYNLILKMADKGANGNQIFEQLNKQHLKVSRRTVYNILAGQKTLL